MSWQTKAGSALVGAGLLAGKNFINTVEKKAESYILNQGGKRLLDIAYKNTFPTAEKLKNLGSRTAKEAITPKSSQAMSNARDLSSLSSGVGALLSTAVGAIGSAADKSFLDLSSASAEQKTANDFQKTKHADSHFLNNQVDLKQSVDYLIDAINAQTIAMFQAINPISLQLASLVVAVQASTDAILGLDPSVPPTVVVHAPTIPDYTTQMDRMAESADAVKEHHDYLKSPLMAPDTTTQTGTIELSPRDAQHAKNAHHARGESDENNIGGDLFSELEEIYDSNELNMIKMFAYTRIDSGFGSLNSTDNSVYDSMIDERYKL